MRYVLAAAMLLCVSANAVRVSAQETRIAAEGHVPPPATLGQMEWLVGQWEGERIGGNSARESWLPPTGNTMVGTFVQTEDDGNIQFTEHLYLMEESGTLVLRLKHFNADLTGWEDRDGMLTFRLVGVEPCAAWFSSLTLRCDGEDGLLAAVRMQSDGDTISELVFRFRRAGADTVPGRCPGSETTIDMNECHAALLERADARRAEYLAAALERHQDRPALAARIAAGDAAFRAYRDAECDAVLEDWIAGTIRGVMTLGCRIDMTDRRTHAIWQNWLTYMDSTPPLLPEPRATL